jgi:hypothetical protein
LSINTLTLKNVNQILGFVLMGSAIMLSPVYFYASGLPQPTHILIFLAAIVLIAINSREILGLISKNKIGLLFLFLVAFINFIYANFYQDKSFILNTSYWVYGFILTLAIIINGSNKLINLWVTRLIFLKFGIIFLAYLFGLGGYLFWPRYDYFFNGPNQLANFIICLFIIYLTLTKAKFNFALYTVYILTIFIITSTGGRSAYLAIPPILIILLWMAPRSIKHMLLLISIPFAVTLIFKFMGFPIYSPGANQIQSKLIHHNVESTSNADVASNTGVRILSLVHGNDGGSMTAIRAQLRARGYMRAIDYPEYLIFGAGQGRDNRFEDTDGHYYEIHSSLFAVWFYYGILGISLFLWFIWNLFAIKMNILLLAPIFIYGLFTYGLRAPYFWIALAFLALAPNLFSQNIVKNEEN